MMNMRRADIEVWSSITNPAKLALTGFRFILKRTIARLDEETIFPISAGSPPRFIASLNILVHRFISSDPLSLMNLSQLRLGLSSSDRLLCNVLTSGSRDPTVSRSK